MKRLKNYVGALTHVMAGWVPLFWVAGFAGVGGVGRFLGLMGLCGLFSLLPDVDVATSFVGRWAGGVSKYIERGYGHRTITHSWVALLVVFVATRFFMHGWLLFAAYASHLLVDALVGKRGIALFWPSTVDFNVARLESGGTGERLLAGVLFVLLLAPFVWPRETNVMVNAVSRPTFTPTLGPLVDTISVDVPHVRDKGGEILIKIGDGVAQDQLIADLVGYRASLPTVTPTFDPKPTATEPPDPVEVARLEKNLEAVRATATAKAQILPPDAACLGKPSRQLAIARATATQAALWAARPEREGTVGLVVDEGVLVQVEAGLAHAKALHEGRLEALSADLQAAQFKATAEVQQIREPPPTPVPPDPALVMKAQMALEVAVLTQLREAATATAYGEQNVDPACLDQPSQAVIVARQTLRQAQGTAAAVQQANTVDPQPLTRVEAESTIAMAEHERQLAELEGDWQAAVLGATATVLALTPTYTPMPPTPTPTSSATPPIATVAPLTGTIAPLTGTIAPLTGTIAPLAGTIAPPTGTIALPIATIAPPTATVAPLTGTIAPLTGTIAPLTGTIAPLTATVAPLTGTIAPPTATVAPLTGTIAPPTATAGLPTLTGTHPISTSVEGILTTTHPISTLYLPLLLKNRSNDFSRSGPERLKSLLRGEERLKSLLRGEERLKSLLRGEERLKSLLRGKGSLLRGKVGLFALQTVSGTVDIEVQQVEIEVNEARARYESGRAQVEGEMALERLRATETVEALQPDPSAVERAVGQLMIAEQEHERGCLRPTPDPSRAAILKKEVELAELALQALQPTSVPAVSEAELEIELQKVQLELDGATARYESGRAEAEAVLDLARAEATATVQALQPTPFVVTPVTIEQAAMLLEIAVQAHRASCTPPTPDPIALSLVERDVEVAELRLTAAVSAPAAANNADNAPTSTPQPISASEGVGVDIDETRIYSPVAGTVQQIQTIKADGRYVTIRIVIALVPPALAEAPEVEESPVSGEESLVEGEEPLVGGEESPVGGEEAPNRPSAGSPSTGLGGGSGAPSLSRGRADGEATGCPHLPKGHPIGLPDSNQFICRDIYALSANIESKFADFVAYCITPQTITGAGEQSRTWKADPDLPEDATLEPDDYRGANEALGTDRGHLAPLASFRGANWQQTNYLSNIVPQKSVLNRGAWKDIEDRERDLTRKYGHLCAITGPLYQRDMANLPNADEAHRVPSGFYKIISYGSETEAYLFDQDTPKGTDYRSGSTTVEQIEALTGFDFP